jgi:hypothetical protein
MLTRFRKSITMALRVGPLALLALEAQAQTNTVASQRILLVVETSARMQPRAAGVASTVQDLLASNLQGQIRPGDTLGLWTYNQEVYTGKFPLQHWSAAAKPQIIQALSKFLSNQPFEKNADFSKVLPGIKKIVGESQLSTIILISSGEENISGTPFDARINANFEDWRVQQRKAGLPFVTIFRGVDGHLTGCAASPAPWPLDLPPLPKIAAIPPKAVTETAAVPPARPAATAPPLIVSGKKPAAQPPTPATNSLRETNTAAPLSTSGPAEITAVKANPAPLAKPVPQVVHQPQLTNALSALTNASPAMALENAAPRPAATTNLASDFSGSHSTMTVQPATPVTNATRSPAQWATASNQRNSRAVLPLIIAGTTLLIGVFLLWRFRSRSTHTSLITESLERDKH